MGQQFPVPGGQSSRVRGPAPQRVSVSYPLIHKLLLFLVHNRIFPLYSCNPSPFYLCIPPFPLLLMYTPFSLLLMYTLLPPCTYVYPLPSATPSPPQSLVSKLNVRFRLNIFKICILSRPYHLSNIYTVQFIYLSIYLSFYPSIFLSVYSSISLCL